MFGYEVRRTTEVTPDGQYEWVFHVDHDCCIPYHSKTDRYTLAMSINEYAYQALSATRYFDEWFWMTASERTTIRRETLLNNVTATEVIARHQESLKRLQDNFFSFVTFPGTGTSPVTKSTTEQENTMTTDARYHVERDLSKAYNAATHHLRKKHHIDPHQPATIREYISMIKEGKHDEITDKELDRKLDTWEHAAGHIVLRQHPADHTAHKADSEKLDEAYRSAALAVKTAETDDKARKDVSEPFRKQWIH